METTEKHYLSFSAKEIDRRLEKVDDIPTRVSQLINDKGYITANDIPEVEIPDNIATIEDVAKKQDKIEDLDTIRSGAAKGATAIQEVKTINGQSIVGSGNISIEGGSGDVDLSGYVTKVDADKTYQPKGDYALKSELKEVPTKVSELENDSNFVSSLNLKTVDGVSIVGEGDIDTGGLYVFEWDGETEEGAFTQEEYDKLIHAKKRAIKFDANIVFATAEEYKEDGTIVFIGQIILGAYILIFNASFTPTSYTMQYEFQVIPTRTSEIENDSQFVNEEQLATKQDKLIEGEGISIEEM